MDNAVRVIAEFTQAGEIKPYRIQITEGDEEITCNIESFIAEKQRDIIKYKCKLIINNTVKRADIWYYRENCYWRLYNLK